MASFNVPFTILQGETYDETLTWKVGDPAVAVDLTGYTARAQVRSSVTSSIVLLELTTENGGIVLGGAAGTIQRIVSAADTAAITWKNAVYDLEVIDAGGAVRRLMSGKVTVSLEVTRD